MASSVMSPLDALVVPHVIYSDVPIVPPADVPVTHPHVTHIGGSKVTFSTTMDDPIAAHMSHIHEGIHSSSFVEGEVHSAE